MPIYTPNGLKIRLDSEAVEEIIQPLAEHHDMNDVLLDVELWEDLPEGFTAISVSIAALFFASSVGPLLITGLLAYIVGSFVRSLMYSDLLRVFVNSLGAWLPTLVHTVAISVYLAWQANYFLAATLVFFNVIVVHSGLLEFLLIPFSPLRVSIRRALGHLPTHQEEIFMTICGRRAAKYGVELDWTAYAAVLRTIRAGGHGRADPR